MKINWSMVVGFIAWLTLSISIICWVVDSSDKEFRTRYEMPNGIVCNSSIITGGGFGGATHEFYRCSDGRRYVNPEYYNKYMVDGVLSESHDE